MNKKIKKIRFFFLDLPRDIKLIISLVVDSFLCISTVWFAFYLRLGEFVNIENFVILPSFLSIVFAIPVFYFSGLYRTIFKNTSISVTLSAINLAFSIPICLIPIE